MTESGQTKIDLSGLAEFEEASSTSLAPFEDGASILLDDFTLASPNLLDEFNASVDLINGVNPEPGEESPDEDFDEGSFELDSAFGEEPEEVDEIDGYRDDLLRSPSEEDSSAVDRGRVSQPDNPVIGFACRHAADLPGIMDSHGRMVGRNIVNFIEFPCAGMVKPGWLTEVLEKGASGVFVVACYPGVCHHRRGACIFEGRWEGSREPSISPDADQSRMRLIFGHVEAREDLLKQIEGFLDDVAKLDHIASQNRKIPEEDSGDSNLPIEIKPEESP